MMETNNNYENHEKHLIIYTILLNLTSGFFHSIFGYSKDNSKAHMNAIAFFGNSNNLYESQTPDEIHKAFITIANAITPKFGLKLK